MIQYEILVILFQNFSDSDSQMLTLASSQDF